MASTSKITEDELTRALAHLTNSCLTDGSGRTFDNVRLNMGYDRDSGHTILELELSPSLKRSTESYTVDVDDHFSHLQNS